MHRKQCFSCTISFSTITNLKVPQSFDEDITDLLPSEITNSRGLTQAHVMALIRSEKTGNTSIGLLGVEMGGERNEEMNGDRIINTIR